MWEGLKYSSICVSSLVGVWYGFASQLSAYGRVGV